QARGLVIKLTRKMRARAGEVKENGVDLVELQVKILKNVEELTLHLIELKKENEQLKAEFIKLK
ncbi:MAG TPA: hypothetical protein PK809_11980, partial [Bacteroidia bacterium]|nr:hypothetical protein [Bacteroidia bacterium]